MSDTLHFRSPTTTDRDRYAVEALLPIAWIVDLDAYVSQMFDAKSDLSWYSALDIVQMDAKQFEINGIKIWIWVMETTNPESALQLKDSLLKATQETKDARWVEYMLFCVIDILKEHNTTLVIWKEEEALLKNVFQVETNNCVADMWWRISRKKQLAKQLVEYFG
jgi:manganese-dependent inorganic pyrophosphatase